MRTWMLTLLLYAVAAIGGDRGSEPSYQFVEFVVATAERASPSRCTSSRGVRMRVSAVEEGKPCGNTCNEKDDVCHLPPGCAR